MRLKEAFLSYVSLAPFQVLTGRMRRGRCIAQDTSIVAESSAGQSWSGKRSPGTVRATTTYCLKCQSGQSCAGLSSTLVKQWVSWGLGISTEQVRSWGKQFIKPHARRPAHTQRTCAFSLRPSLLPPRTWGKAHFWAKGRHLLSLNSGSKVTRGSSISLCYITVSWGYMLYPQWDYPSL